MEAYMQKWGGGRGAKIPKNLNQLTNTSLVPNATSIIKILQQHRKCSFIK